MRDFSAETLQARRKWHDMFRVEKDNLKQDYHSEETEFISTKPTLKEMLKGLL